MDLTDCERPELAEQIVDFLVVDLERQVRDLEFSFVVAGRGSVVSGGDPLQSAGPGSPRVQSPSSGPLCINSSSLPDFLLNSRVQLWPVAFPLSSSCG